MALPGLYMASAAAAAAGAGAPLETMLASCGCRSVRQAQQPEQPQHTITSSILPHVLHTHFTLISCEGGPSQVLGMWQAQQPEQPQQTTVIQRARSDAAQPPPSASAAPAVGAAVSTGFSAFSQQREAAVSPAPQVRAGAPRPWHADTDGVLAAAANALRLRQLGGFSQPEPSPSDSELRQPCLFKQPRVSAHC